MKKHNLLGERFGSLTVIAEAESIVQGTKRKFKVAHWLCRCDCGAEKIVAASNLRSGSVSSCGCLSRKINLVGRHFGRLTVLNAVNAVAEGKDPLRTWWLCQCECGKAKIIDAGHLASGDTSSCGCLRNSKIALVNAKHGYAGKNASAEYIAWKGIRARCLNPENPRWVYYGGRGIKVCERWLESFENFLDDMGARPSPIHSIDRIDVNGDYEPGNCRWATKLTQANNTRTTVLIDYEGKTYPMTAFCKHLGLNYQRFRYLYRVCKLPLNEAIRLT